MFQSCALGAYQAGSGYMTHYQIFDSVNNFILSGMQNFLGQVFTVNKIYERYIEALTYNDVDQQWFYLGEILFYLTDFPLVDLTTDDPSLEWEQANTNSAQNPLVKNNHPQVSAHLDDFGLEEVIQLGLNLVYGVFENILTLKTEQYTNCTVQASMQLIYY